VVRSLEEFVARLWTGDGTADIFDTPLHVVGGASAPGLPMLNRMQSILPLVAARDALAGDLTPGGIARTGWRIVNLLASVAAEARELEPTVEETLARAWDGSPARIRAAIMRAASREADAADRVAREIARTGANPYAVVGAALFALRVPRSRLENAEAIHAIGRTIAWIAGMIRWQRGAERARSSRKEHPVPSPRSRGEG
jgi:citrate synthase